MRSMKINDGWYFGLGPVDWGKRMQGEYGNRTVNLPHDYMIEGDVYAEAPSGPASARREAIRSGCFLPFSTIFRINSMMPSSDADFSCYSTSSRYSRSAASPSTCSQSAKSPDCVPERSGSKDPCTGIP